jgi:hypothetical protein
VLDAIARVLQMSEDERRYLHVLAFGAVQDSQPLISEIPADEIVRQLVASTLAAIFSTGVLVAGAQIRVRNDAVAPSETCSRRTSPSQGGSASSIRITSGARGAGSRPSCRRGSTALQRAPVG